MPHFRFGQPPRLKKPKTAAKSGIPQEKYRIVSALYRRGNIGPAAAHSNPRRPGPQPADQDPRTMAGGGP